MVSCLVLVLGRREAMCDLAAQLVRDPVQLVRVHAAPGPGHQFTAHSGVFCFFNIILRGVKTPSLQLSSPRSRHANKRDRSTRPCSHMVQLQTCWKKKETRQLFFFFLTWRRPDRQTERRGEEIETVSLAVLRI